MIPELRINESGHIPIERRFSPPSNESLRDPEYQRAWGSLYASQTLCWADLLPRKRTVILGEGKCGKTHEFSRKAAELRELGLTAVFVPLEQLHDHQLVDVLSPADEESLNRWLTEPISEAWFFLDAVDELKLGDGHFKVALRKLQRVIRDKAQYAHIFVSCRPADWNQQLDLTEFRELFPTPPRNKMIGADSSPEDSFVKVVTRQAGDSRSSQKTEDDDSSEPSPQVLALLPLTPDEAIEFAAEHDSEKAKGLREEIDRQETWHLFQTPADIIDALANIEEIGRLGSLQDQIAAGINRKLREVPGKGLQSLPHDKARQGAERLSLALSLARRQSLLLQKTTDHHALDVGSVLTDWTQDEQLALLSRGLFAASGVNAVRFHHRSTQEFLAAQRLQQLLAEGLGIREILQLLLAEKYGVKVIIPSMEGVAAWLALSRNDVLAAVRERKPEILFRRGMPACLSFSLRVDLLQGFVSAYKGDDWRGVEVDYREVQRLGHPDLGPVITDLWDNAYAGHDTRELLLRLIELTPLPSCVDLAFRAAFDNGLPEAHRVFASRVVLASGSENQRRAIGEAVLSQNWSQRLVHALIGNLYPAALSLDETVRLAKETEEASNTITGLGYGLYNLARSERLEIPELRGLRALLTNSVWEHRLDNSMVHRAHTAFDHFTDAVLAGCARDAQLDTSLEKREWAWSATVALHFGERRRSIIAKRDTDLVISRLQDDPQLREAYYWATFELAEGLEPANDGWSRYIRADAEDAMGAITPNDFPWLMTALEDASEPARRSLALYGLMRAWAANREPHISEAVSSRIQDSPELLQEFDRFVNPPQEKTHDARRPEDVRTELERKKKEADGLKAWREWYRQCQTHPAQMFEPDNRARTLFNLHNWLRLGESGGSSWCYWNVESIGESFSTEFLELARAALAASWREESPLLWSEREANKRNSYPWGWIHGLNALMAEADDSEWAKRLTASEAKLAARFSTLELNGLASFLPDLEKAHPKAVQEVFIGELDAQMKQLAVIGESPILRDLKYHGTEKLNESAASFLAENLSLFPLEMTPGTRSALSDASELIVQHTPADKTNAAAAHAEVRLVNNKLSCDDRVAWLATLALLHPKLGCEQILQETRQTDTEDETAFASQVFATVFGDRHSGPRPDFSQLSEEDRAETLLRLVRRVFAIAHPSTDITHDDVYTPGIRDNAEHARRFLFDSLVSTECVHTFKALLQLATLGDFSHMKDRLRQLANDLAAHQAERPPMTAAQFLSLDQKQTLVPTDNQSIHQVMLNRLEDLFHEIQESEFSIRRTLQRIEEETELRRYTANWLNEHSRDCYRVNQEAVKKDETRTDIRLNATAVDIESVIELKLDDSKGRWTGSELEDALRRQLVGQYLSHNRCRSGCLLICMREERKWENPATGVRMNHDETVAWLQGVADEVAKERPELLLSVRGLDLTGPTKH